MLMPGAVAGIQYLTSDNRHLKMTANKNKCKGQTLLIPQLHTTQFTSEDKLLVGMVTSDHSRVSWIASNSLVAHKEQLIGQSHCLGVNCFQMF